MATIGDLLSVIELEGIREDVKPIFVDEIHVWRQTSIGTLNEATSLHENPTTLTIYLGPAQLTPIRSRRDKFDEIGGGSVFTRQYRLSVPYTAGLADPLEGIQIRDRASITISRDPQAIGREMEVRDVVVSSNIGYRQVTLHDFRE